MNISTALAAVWTMGHRHQHVFPSPAAAQTMEVFQRGLIQKMNHSASRTSCHYPEPGQSCSWPAHSLCQLHSAMACSQVRHTCHHSHSSPALPPHLMPTVQSPFYLSVAYLITAAWHCTLSCITQYFLFFTPALYANAYYNKSLVSFKVSGSEAP